MISPSYGTDCKQNPSLGMLAPPQNTDDIFHTHTEHSVTRGLTSSQLHITPPYPTHPPLREIAIVHRPIRHLSLLSRRFSQKKTILSSPTPLSCRPAFSLPSPTPQLRYLKIKVAAVKPLNAPPRQRHGCEAEPLASHTHTTFTFSKRPNAEPKQSAPLHVPTIIPKSQITFSRPPPTSPPPPFSADRARVRVAQSCCLPCDNGKTNCTEKKKHRVPITPKKKSTKLFEKQNASKRSREVESNGPPSMCSFLEQAQDTSDRPGLSYRLSTGGRNHAQ